MAYKRNARSWRMVKLSLCTALGTLMSSGHFLNAQGYSIVCSFDDAPPTNHVVFAGRSAVWTLPAVPGGLSSLEFVCNETLDVCRVDLADEKTIVIVAEDNWKKIRWIALKPGEAPDVHYYRSKCTGVP